MAKKTVIDSTEKAQILLDAVEDRLAIDPTLLDLRDKNVLLYDYRLVCTGNSSTHIRAIAEKVIETTEEANWTKPRIEGQAVGEWVLLDFGDVILDIMLEETRDRYKLEEFWSTPQPKGALPPTPGDSGPYAGKVEEPDPAGFDDDNDTLDEDLDEDDLDDVAFFEDVETEVEPIDEDDDFDDENSAETKEGK